MKRSVVPALALALAACGGAQDPAGVPAPVLAEVGEEFVLAPGGEARLEDGFVLAFVGVAEDSRCPSDVQCPWEGNAVVLLRATLEGEDREVRLETREGPQAAVGSRLVTLVELAPTPVSTRALEQRDYRATLRVERRELEP